MPLNPGTRLGPYEVLAPLGAGGMGEVYRARDTRLGRDVAVKVLPAHLSANPEVRARFEREAKAVSSLSHPHICALYDVGRASVEAGAPESEYLVMELLEGETLAQRLARGPLPFDQVVRHGVEIADALDRAHRQGLVHRDLKPGNVMLTRSGAKLLDFGLARATGMSRGISDLTSSPTVAAPLTAEGTIVGTFQYMAPEQLEGKEADARSDLWSFGAMLYEMATGRRAFDGRSQASLIAAILEREPAPMNLPPSTPGTPEPQLAALEPLVRACLAKDPEERVQTAHDVKLQLRWLAGGSTASVANTSGLAAPAAAARRHSSALAWSVAAAALLAAVILGALLLRPAPPRGATRFTIALDPRLRSMTWPRLSPDGRTLAFVGTDTTGVTAIWLRPLGSLEAAPLAGTEAAGRPFWSPDSRSLAYFTAGKLVKVAIGGGPPQVVAEGTGGADGAWGSRGMVVFDGSTGDSIRAIPIAGGPVVGASSLDRRAAEISHNWPIFLPDGRHFLAMVDLSDKPSRLHAFTLGSRESRDLGPIGSRVEYAPPGYLLWVANDVLLARRFDVGGLRFTGDAFAVASGVSTNLSRANVTVSNDGTLVFARAGAVGQNRLVWFDRSGKSLGDVGPPGAYGEIALSPDGKRIAFDRADPTSGASQIWVRDLARDVETRITFGSGNAMWPTWSPDGRTIAYASDRKGPYAVFLRESSGAGEDTLVRTTPDNEGPTDWPAPDVLVLGHYVGARGDVEVIEPKPGAPHHAVLATPASEQLGHLSPDGKWIVYSSDESGRSEIYVQTYPTTGGKWQISSKGGSMPQWRGDGREIYYYSSTRELKAVTFVPGPSPEIGMPVTLFEQVLAPSAILRNRYVASPDGQRFLLNVPPVSRDAASFTVIENWTSEIAKK